MRRMFGVGKMFVVCCTGFVGVVIGSGGLSVDLVLDWVVMEVFWRPDVS